MCLGIMDWGGLDGEKVQVNDRGGGGRDGVWRGTWVVVGIVYWRCLMGAVVRLMSSNSLLKASRLLLDGSLFHWASVRGKKLYL